MIVTNAILFFALIVAMALVLRIRWCSYDYSRINSTPVLIVLVMYMLSYFVRAIYLIKIDDYLEA